MLKRSKEASVGNLKRFFLNTPNDDYISLTGIYVAWERTQYTEDKNKIWLGNVLTSMKYHNLVKPVYKVRNGRRVLDGIELTMEGKKALGRIEGVESISDIRPTNNWTKELSVEQIMKAMPRLRRENPEFNITFSVVPKESL